MNLNSLESPNTTTHVHHGHHHTSLAPASGVSGNANSAAPADTYHGAPEEGESSLQPWQLEALSSWGGPGAALGVAATPQDNQGNPGWTEQSFAAQNAAAVNGTGTASQQDMALLSYALRQNGLDSSKVDAALTAQVGDSLQGRQLAQGAAGGNALGNFSDENAYQIVGLASKGESAQQIQQTLAGQKGGNTYATPVTLAEVEKYTTLMAKFGYTS